ncbi:MAG: amino acid ABC transporter substrate-binding protein [Deltaproteobacteria bacterium]|nr:amino acid ABC transporter substrate-binding protein [Deltaproteobacteria bacterium]
MKKIATLLLLLIIIFLIVRENTTKRPNKLYQTASGQVDMCLKCHGKVQLDPAHDTKVMGCSACHLGNPLAISKAKAHKGIVRNPGDLRVVDRTCGVNGCHAIHVPEVKNSLMATNRGIIATLRYYWGEAPNQNGDYSVKQLMDSHENSLALDYYRKLCATCHLWKQKGDLPGFFGTKGGGCTACHHEKNPNLPLAEAQKAHPWVTKKVPVANCVRCHNRSGRIGISYTGKYESEGSGAPFVKGKLSPNRLPGDRFFFKLPADIHYRKGMACIDCHTQKEIMGDGKRYAHFEEQLEISCSTCHTSSKVGITRKGNKLDNVDPDAKPWPVLTGKLDGRKHLIKPPLAGVCDYTGHKRLSCQACHSTWVPQCYGCHVKRDMRETHLDKLTLKETPGWWEEGRSYIRYEQPALGIWDNRVMPVTPGCQDMVTLKDKRGKITRSFYSFTMAAIDPHTTQATARKCEGCHMSPKTLGLGQGTVWLDHGKWRFSPATQGINTPTGKTPPLDAFVTIDGTALQKGFRPSMRPFNRVEIDRILRVGLCLPCHDSIRDKIYHPFKPDAICPKKIIKKFSSNTDR